MSTTLRALTAKGSPTPKAPQNQPKAKPGPARTPSFEEREIERHLNMTSAQRIAHERRRLYLDFRHRTRPFRRAFGGELRARVLCARTARLTLTRDAVRVARVVEELGGVEDVRTIAQRVELPQARVRATLALLAAEVAA